jgi:hypothetical protein
MCDISSKIERIRVSSPGNEITILQGGFPALSATFILDQMCGLIDRGFSYQNWAFYNPQSDVSHEQVDE